MRTVSLGVIVFVLALPASSVAHRLDEYLQAARVALSRGQVAIEIDLTPGATIAAEIVALIDRDADHRVSPLEAEAYGRAVVGDLILEIDGRPISLALTRVEISSVEEMSDGVGTIQLRLVGDVHEIAHGPRHLFFRNDHRPDRSVYLVNPLVPEHRQVVLAAQMRDPRQREIHLEYDVRAASRTELAWLLLAAGVLTTLLRYRTLAALG